MLALNPLSRDEKRYWLLFAVAALSFLPTLFFYYTGEEAIFPIISQEMWENGNWLKQSLYGGDPQHNPLFNWLIIPFSLLFGWEHVLTVTRALAIASTLTTSLILAWMAGRLFHDRAFGIFAALGYLTMTDVLLYHGWLCYVDPNYAMFIFAAIAALWVGVHEQRIRLVVISGMLITCAFLSKALTAYIFYGGVLFVLLFNAQQRRFLLDWRAISVLLLTFIGPFIWYTSIPDGVAQGIRMFNELTEKFAAPSLLGYFARLLYFPMDVLASLAPVTLLAIYFWVRKRNRPETSLTNRLLFVTACGMLLIDFLPYWISPRGGLRYLIPIYPLFALVAARIIWQSGDAALTLTRKWIIAALALKFAVALVIFPYYQEHYRGANHANAASDIVSITEGHSLYVKTPSAYGLSVAAYINQQRYPQKAVRWPPEQWQDGFMLVEPRFVLQSDRVFKEYPLAAEKLYLLCRGSACDKLGAAR